VKSSRPGLRERWRLYLILRTALVAALAGLVLGLIRLAWSPPDLAWPGERSVGLLVGIALLAAAAEYVDSAVGMGFGTVMAPVLLVVGFDVEVVLPAVLTAESLSGFFAAVLHHRAANVDLSAGSRDRGVVATMLPPALVGAAAGGVVGGVLGAFPGEIVVGGVIFVTGAVLLLQRGTVREFRWRSVAVLGLLASAAKGLSSAGFGPVVTGGQMVIGIPERDAVGVTSAVEAPVSLVALVAFGLVAAWPAPSVTLALVAGALAGVPAAVWTVRLLPTRSIRLAVGMLACALGALALFTGVG
jgi:uncharacterized membrane protein YfcA